MPVSQSDITIKSLNNLRPARHGRGLRLSGSLLTAMAEETIVIKSIKCLETQDRNEKLRLTHHVHVDTHF